MLSSKVIKEYWQITTSIASRYHVYRLPVLARIIYCRILYGFGPKDFVLYGFYYKKISAPKSYIKNESLEVFQRKVNKTPYRMLADDKLAFYLRCKEYGLPTPEVLAVISAKLEVAAANNIRVIDNLAGVLKMLIHNGNGSYLLKPIDGSFGQNLYRINLFGSKVYADNQEDISLIIENILANQTPYIIQRYLQPHASLSPIMPNGLGTARIITVNDGQNIKVWSRAQVKMPTGQNVMDNFAHGKNNNLIAGVNFDGARLLTPFGSDVMGLGLIEQVIQHPDTEFKVCNFEFPCWNELINTVVAGAEAFKELYTIGWDVALTVDGPCLIEANWRYDSDAMQVVYDMGLKREFLELLGC